ncbi:DUF6456 domain-containing protein [Sphingomonas sp. FW199]|uniref:DUF6456 domain-containing protein n=1 Tax=Sphingomonas sp. FW199 TaxID=3400217 RepID=UPI003CEDB98E
MSRMIVERSFSDDRIGSAPPQRGQRGVQVNLGESALSWLFARGHLNPRQNEAGERLRADYERAALAPGVTMRWTAAPASGGRRGPPAGVDASMVQIDAKRRFDAAMAATGPGLSDILWRVVCADERLAGAEQAMGWPARSGKLVLGIALDRLADHYGLG